MLSLRLFQASSELSSFSTILWRAYLDIFWESYPKQKRLKSHIINNFLLPKRKEYPVLWEKRKEIAQKLLELAYHIYGGSK